MIANPGKRFFMYNPYEQILTEEFYEWSTMVEIRKRQIELLPKKSNLKLGLIIGVLGRQGNLGIVEVFL